MTAQILRSQTLEFANFELEVQSFSAELKQWRAHMRRVDEDVANNVPAEEAHAAFPMPQASQVVISAIGENDDPDFTIVEDGEQVEDLRLRDVRKLAIQNVLLAEAAAIDAAFPPGKRKLAEMRVLDIEAQDRKLASERIAALDIGFVDRMTGSGKKKFDAAVSSEAIRAARSREDNEFMDGREAIGARIRRIQRWAAEQTAAIEDMSIEKLQGWSVPEAPQE